VPARALHGGARGHQELRGLGRSPAGRLRACRVGCSLRRSGRVRGRRGAGGVDTRGRHQPAADGLDPRVDGVRGLYRGFGLSILTYAPSNALWWSTYAVARRCCPCGLLRSTVLASMGRAASASITWSRDMHNAARPGLVCTMRAFAMAEGLSTV